LTANICDVYLLFATCAVRQTEGRHSQTQNQRRSTANKIETVTFKSQQIFCND